MPTFISLKAGVYALAEDPFTAVGDEQSVPPGDVIISLSRFQSEGEALLGEGRAVGVRLESHEEVEALAYDLPQIAVVALAFPKFGDGRAYSYARLLARAVRVHRARCAPSATCFASRRASWSAAASTASSRQTAPPWKTGEGPPSASGMSTSAPTTARPAAFVERGG